MKYLLACVLFNATVFAGAKEPFFKSQITKEVFATTTTYSALIAGSRILKATVQIKKGQEEISCISHDADRPFADEHPEPSAIYYELKYHYQKQSPQTNADDVA